MTVVNDTFIMERMKAGDDSAFRFVFDHNYSLLFRFAYTLLHDKALAEEAADDAILYLWQNCGRIEITRSVRSYLMQAVRSLCIDRMRSSQRLRRYETTDVTPQDNLHFLQTVFNDKDHPLGSLLAEELEQVLNHSIDRLPRECREVFRRSRFRHESYEKIATDLGISVNTVKYHMKKALTILRHDLAGYLHFLTILLLIK